jgi:hypothetical protein
MSDQSGHQFNLNEVSYRGTPQPRSVFNEFDSHGTYLGLERLPQERNAEYKKRLLDVFARRASSTYLGLLNGITRELGLEWSRPIVISVDPAHPVNKIPAIIFQESRVYIYSDYSTAELELEINRSDEQGDSYLLKHLVDKINTESSVFDITIQDLEQEYIRSDSLINQSSIKESGTLPLTTSHIQVLGVQNIIPGSVELNDRNTYRFRVETLVEVTAAGKYHIDYDNGVITSFQSPAEGSTINYKYNVLPLEPLASPVILRTIQHEDFQRIMYQQVLDDLGDATHGIPTDLGAEIINELLSVVPMYWGL